MSRKRILVISPHPDDLEIGMGGTTRMLLEKDMEVLSVIVTDGRRCANPMGLTQDELIAAREQEVRKSSEILGVELLFLGFSDMESNDNKSQFFSRIQNIIAQSYPDEMYMPHPKIDRHKTHRIVSQLTLDCIDAMTGKSTSKCKCWCYEVWTPFPSYDRIEDITPFADLKRMAIEAHKSQTAYKDYTEGIMGLNRYRGVFNDTADGFAPTWAEVFIKYDF